MKKIFIIFSAFLIMIIIILVILLLNKNLTSINKNENEIIPICNWETQNDEDCYVASCYQKNFNMVFVLVYKTNYDDNELERLKDIKRDFSRAFSVATNNLATMDTSYPIVLLKLPEQQTQYDYSLIIDLLYNSYGLQDNFEFISIYDNFDESNRPIFHRTLISPISFATGDDNRKISNLVGVGLNKYYSVDKNTEKKNGRVENFLE